MMKPFNTVGVIGSGTMGAGIAQVVALAGYKTVLYDVNAEILQVALTRIEQAIAKGIQKGKLSPEARTLIDENLRTTHDLQVLGQGLDLIIEAVPEDLALKCRIFTDLEAICPETTAFVSNTSSLSITALGASTQRSAQFAGLHFFNPVPQMKLVEVIQGKQTDLTLIQKLRTFAESLGKTPVTAKDTPGFIVNRVARAFYGEAIRLLDEGVTDVSTIDAIMKGEGGFAMGPFELMDLIGIDVNFAVSQSVYEAFFQEDRFRPHPIQQQMVEAGYLGRKTGKGFYTYEPA